MNKDSLNRPLMNDVVNRNRNKPKDPITTVPKRDVFIVLPYLGLQSKFITKQLKSCIYKFYGCINLKILFRNISLTRTGLTALSSQLRLSTRLAAGTVMTFTLIKRSVDYPVGKLNISKYSRRVVKHQPLRIILLQPDIILMHHF